MEPKAIDIHTHLLPERLPDWKAAYGYGGFVRLEHHAPCRARMVRDDGRFFREIESNCWDPERRLSECDAARVGAQVLSSVPVLFSYWAKPEHGYDLARYLNDHLAGVVAGRPDRFAGLATLPMQAPELAAQELERAVRELGLGGAQIGSHVGEWNLDARELYPVYETAERLGACLFVHPWDMMGEARMPKYWLPWLVGMPAECSLAICSMIFGGIFERFPRLRIAFAHGGGAFAGTLGRIQHGFEARPDLCAADNPTGPRHYLGRFFVDSLVHDARTLGFILSVFGERAVALGSDYPFPLGEERPGELIRSMTSLSERTRERLLRGTALEWLGAAGAKLGGAR